MRRAIAASFGFALALVLMGCGDGAQSSADTGEIYVQVRGALDYSQMQVVLTSATEPEVTINLNKDGDTFIGSQTGLTPGIWTGQLRGYGFGWDDVGESIEIEIQAGVTTEAIFVVPEKESSNGKDPRITTVVVSNSKVPTLESIFIVVSVAGSGTYTVSGSAPTAAGSFGAATDTKPYTLEFTAGETLGFYDLTVTATLGDDSDNVTFQIEVIEGTPTPTTGDLDIVARGSDAPTVEITSDKTVVRGTTADPAYTDIDFTITATANGDGAGHDLNWSFLVEADYSPTGDNCSQGIWTVDGADTTETVSGTMPSGSTFSAHLSIPTVEAAGGWTKCAVKMEFTDSVGSSVLHSYTIDRSLRNVSFTE